ncbi:transporter substrate-binding domain-containing protein [Skermanella sp. TT6]|uniref:Transporter substrate-binding domain-containing protein n=1 Tax=Skermanella cutis TaxID=2775420 RepID=A0ABX7B005_9PROT|nr:transporter substrate-binding domain-containing protein [Skermanella sp. TT6]QQP87658.1 transporter substrate-binding domain-containing protein [Skermanella sp. TT6]
MHRYIAGSGSWPMLAVAFLLLLAGAGWAFPAQAGPLKVVYVELPPYTYTDPDGTPKGSLIELTRKVAADAGVEFTAESVPARRLFQGIAAGEYDMFIGIKTPEAFQGTTVASRSVIARIDLHAWSFGAVPEIRAKEDLAGKQVIVLTGYSYGGWRSYFEDPANGIQMVEARAPEQALQLLVAGRAPILLQYELPMERALGGKRPPDLRSSLISSLDCHFVVSLKRPDAAELVGRLDAGFEKLKAAGALP